jgi:hypothetical protein
MRRPTIRQRLNTLIEEFTPRIRDAFYAAIADVKDGVIMQEMIDAIISGDPERAFRVLGFSDAAMRPISAMLATAFETGGVMTVASFPRVRNPLAEGSYLLRFDVRNSRAEAWLRDHSSQLITRIQNDQREAIRATLFDGMQAGDNPRTTALDIIGRVDPQSKRRVGGIVGLTPGQERYVSNARRQLRSGDPAELAKWFKRELRDKRFDGLVQKAIDGTRPLTADDVSRLTTRYSDSLLRYRGETIGRTEALTSLNKSHDEAFRQAVDTGTISPKAVKRVWDSAGRDGRTRDSHLAMDGQTVGLDEPFKTPSGDLLMFPGDTSLGAPPEETIQCRCRVRFNVDWLEGVE